MEDHILNYLIELNKRLQARGFSWRVDDYLELQEALPVVLEIIPGKGDSEELDTSVRSEITWPNWNLPPWENETS